MARFKLGGENFDKPLKIITINVSITQLKMIRILIDHGIGASRSELMRMMLSEWLPQKVNELRHVKALIKADYNEEKFVRVPNGDGTYTEYSLNGEA